MAKKRNRLTVQQRKLLQGLNQGLTITEAGRRAGYAQRQNAHIAYKHLKLRFHPALESAGYDADKILTETIEKQRSKLSAKETHFFAHRGVVIEQRDVEAHSIQLQAARDLQRLLIVEDERNAAPSEGVGGITINITLDRERRGPQGGHREVDSTVSGNRRDARLIDVDAGARH